MFRACRRKKSSTPPSARDAKWRPRGAATAAGVRERARHQWTTAGGGGVNGDWPAGGVTVVGAPPTAVREACSWPIPREWTGRKGSAAVALISCGTGGGDGRACATRVRARTGRWRERPVGGCFVRLESRAHSHRDDLSRRRCECTGREFQNLYTVFTYICPVVVARSQ